MNEKKYELTDETIEIDGHTLHRIRAVRDFVNIHKGDLGGWIESEKNLSQAGNCQVADNALVLGNAHVTGNACVYDNACVSGNACVYERARIYGNAYVHENAHVYGDARVYNYTVTDGCIYVNC